MSCDRPELFDLYVLAKQGVEDWQGLRKYVETKRFRYTHKDPAVDAYLVASARLENLASARGNMLDASNYAMDGVKRIFDKISGSALDPEYFEFLAKNQNRLAKQAIYHRRKAIQTKRDHLIVADLGFELVDHNILTREVVVAICDGLKNWADALKESTYVDEAALNIMANNTKKLERLKSNLIRCKRDIQMEIRLIEETQKHLGFVGVAL